MGDDVTPDLTRGRDHTEVAQPTFDVVVNHEEQYSIWDTRRELPPGWRAIGFVGPEAACLAHIDEIWTDMRPLSLRQTDGTV